MKPRDLLMSDETLFSNESVFAPAYVPEEFIHRDAQMSQIMLAMKPGMRGVNPVNTIIIGPPGTGKTTAVKFAFKELSEATKKVLPIYVNCEDYSTPYAVFAKIFEAVTGTSPPSTGKPLEEVKEKIFLKLKKEDRGLVVALDEIDRLLLERNMDKILVDLLKSHASYGYDRVGVIGITIREDVMALADDKTRSVYNPSAIRFDRYRRSEIADILANRARHGFYEGVLKNDLLEDIVNKTFESGDLRTGIELMRRSALLAEKDASRSIKREHIGDAHRALPGQKKQEATADISGDEKALLDMVKQDPGKMSGHYFMLFREKTGAGVKRYNESIAKLEKLGLIKAEYKEGMRGRSREIRPA